MKNNLSNQFKPLQSLLYLAALFILLLNDFVLKQTFGNYLTGKLSDFAGVFVFCYFLVALWPKRSWWMGMAGGLFFLYWKLPYSTPFIEALNSIGIPVGRVVDPVDLFSLCLVPVAVWSYKQNCLREYNSDLSRLRWIILVSVFSFVATSRDSTLYFDLNLSSGQEYEVPFARKKWLADYFNVDTLVYEKGLDSAFYIYINDSETTSIGYTAYVRDKDSISSLITIDTIRFVHVDEPGDVEQDETEWLEQNPNFLEKENLEKIFEERLVLPLQQKADTIYRVIVSFY